MREDLDGRVSSSAAAVVVDAAREEVFGGDGAVLVEVGGIFAGG